MTMRYLLVRYVSDLARREPRNVGIVLTSGNEVYAKFVGEKDGRLDLRAVRSLVSHTGTYKQWIDYWRYILAQDIAPDNKLDQVIASSRGNYIAEEGEIVYLPEDVASNPHSALKHLFYLLVDEFPREAEPEADLNARCDEIIREFGLRKNPHFKESPSVDVHVGNGLTQRIVPSFAWVNGVEIYFQKVSLVRTRPEVTQKNVNNAAWIFEKLKCDNSHRQAKALLKVSSETDSERIVSGFDPMLYVPVLKTLADVVDVDDSSSIERVFAPLAVQ